MKLAKPPPGGVSAVLKMTTVADVLLQCEECKAQFVNIEEFNYHPCCKTAKKCFDKKYK